MMRIGFTCAFFLCISVLAAGAEEQSKNPAPQGPCVEVQIGQDATSRLNCLNSQFKTSVERQANAPAVQAPITAQSGSTKVGTANDAAAHQMMGNAYGVSAQPQRPKPVFVSPLLPNAGR